MLKIYLMFSRFKPSGLLYMYRQWVTDGKKIPLDRIIELTGELLTRGIANLAE